MPCLAVDLDGTILECRRRQLRAVEAVLGMHLEPTLADSLWRLKQDGATTLEALRRCAPGLADRFTVERWIDVIETDLLLLDDVLIDGIRSTVDELRLQWSAMHLVTARQRPKAVRPQLRRLGIASAFDCVVVVRPGADVAGDKAQHLLALSADAYVGDTEVDLAAARMAGAVFAAVSSGQRSHAFLTRSGATTFPALREAAEFCRSGVEARLLDAHRAEPPATQRRAIARPPRPWPAAPSSAR